jgi:hypothetical protein
LDGNELWPFGINLLVDRDMVGFETWIRDLENGHKYFEVKKNNKNFLIEVSNPKLN